MAFVLTRFISNDLRMYLESDNTQNMPEDDMNRFSIVIGPNGKGKSRLLAEIAHSFYWKASDQQGIKIPARSDDEATWDRLPNKLLALSNMVFDKYPLGDLENERYIYLGARQASNMLTTSTWSSYIHESFGLLRLRMRLDQLAPTLDLLNLSLYGRPDIYRPIGSKRRLEALTEFLANPEIAKQGYRESRLPRATLRWLDSMRHEQRAELSGILSRVRELPEQRERILDDGLFPLAEDFWSVLGSEPKLAYFLLRNNIIRFRAHFTRYGRGVRVEDLSAGEQLLLSLAARVVAHIQPQSLVLIDEPDVGLHPEWQASFIPLMRQAIPNNFGCHFVLATHSPLVVAEGTDVLVPGVKPGHFVPYKGTVEGRSIETILYEAFESRSPRSQMVERDLNLLISAISARASKFIERQPLLDAMRRLAAISGEDTPVVNRVLSQARSQILWGENDV